MDRQDNARPPQYTSCSCSMHPNMECHSQSQNSRATFDSWSYKKKEVCSFLERGWISSAFHTLSSLAAAFAFDSCPQLPTISLSFFSQRHVSDFIYFSSFFSSSLLLFFSPSLSAKANHRHPRFPPKGPQKGRQIRQDRQT